MKGKFSITSVLLPLHHLLQWTSWWKQQGPWDIFCRPAVDLQGTWEGRCRNVPLRTLPEAPGCQQSWEWSCCPVCWQALTLLQDSVLLLAGVGRVAWWLNALISEWAAQGCWKSPLTLSVRLINSPIKRKRRVAVEISVGCVAKAVWVWSQMELFSTKSMWNSGVFSCQTPSHGMGGWF